MSNYTTSALAAATTLSTLTPPYPINTSMANPNDSGYGGLIYEPLDHPLDQVFTLLLPDGHPFNISVTSLTSYYTYQTRWAVIIGTQIGMCALMFIAVAILAQPAKRKTIIFKLNLMSLLFSCIRLMLTAIFIVGPFSQPYEVLADYFDEVPASEYNVSIAATVFYCLDVLCVLASLLLQMRALLVSTARRWRRGIFGIAILLTFIVAGLQIANMVISIQNVLGHTPDYAGLTITSLCYVMIIASTTYFCIVATIVLSKALWNRRKLGFERFGPIEIIILMGVNTMIIPTIFAFATIDDTSLLHSFYTTLIVIFLPLSSLWATASNDAINSRKNSAATTAPILPTSTTTTHNAHAMGTNMSSGSTAKSSHMTVQLLLSPKTLGEWKRGNLQGSPGLSLGVFGEEGFRGEGEARERSGSGAGGGADGGLHIHVSRS